MTIQKKALIDGLQSCMPGIENGNAILQGADAFIFHDGKIFSYNDTISVAVPISNVGLLEETIEGAVHAEEFFKVVSKLPSEEINFVVTESGWTLKSGKAKVEMTLMNFDYKPRLEGIAPSDSWIDLNDEFALGLGTCKMNSNKTPLAGVCVNGKTILSTDGFQINKFEMKNTELPKFWISDSSVAELLKIKKFKGIQLQGNWIHFLAENGSIFSVKTLQVKNYPFEKIVASLDMSKPNEKDFHANFPVELFNSIDRAGAFSIDITEHQTIRLTLMKENIEVSSERTTGKFKEKVAWETPIENDFEPIGLYVDSSMMAYMATRSLEFYIKNVEKDGQSIPRLIFVSPDSTHLMATFAPEEK